MTFFFTVLTTFLLCISPLYSTSVVMMSESMEHSATMSELKASIAPSSPVENTPAMSAHESMAMSKSDAMKTDMMTPSFSMEKVDSVTKDVMTKSLTESIPMNTEMKVSSSEMKDKMTLTKSITPSPTTMMKVTPSLPPDFEKECTHNCSAVCCREDEIETNYYNETVSCTNLSKDQCDYAKTLHECETKISCVVCKECSGSTSLLASIVLILTTLLLTFQTN